MNYPNLAVLRDRFATGLKSLDDIHGIYPADCSMGIMTALEHEWPSDAHFVTYYIPEEEHWPRLNKPVLSPIREVGKDIVCRYIALDFDNPDHLPWNSDFLTKWINVLSNQNSSFLGDWFCHYTTKAGARLIYIMDEELPVDETEHYVKLIQREWAIHTFMIDRETSDWTRLFRMPKVLRDEERTEESEFFFMEFQERHLSVKASRMQFSAEAPPLKEEPLDVVVENDMLPNDFDAQELIETSVEGRYRMTPWAKKAKKMLRGRECYEVLYGDEEIVPGERDSSLTSYIGQVCSMLYNLQGTTKTHIYGLFYNLLLDMEPDQGTPDWCVAGWSKIERFWAVEKAKSEEREARTSIQELEKRETFDLILEKMRTWSGHNLLDDTVTKEKQFAFIRQCLIAKASTSKFFFIMTDNGMYDPMPLDKESILPRIRALNLEHLYDVYTFDQDGNEKMKNINKILEECCTTVKEVRLVPQLDGGYIQNLNDRAPMLYLPAYRRNPKLTGKFDDGVDEWMEQAFADDKPRVEEWIAWSLAFEEGAICSLSIVGAPKIGKKLLVNGLSECLETPDIAIAEDLVGGYQSGLLSTPFLVVNEGWPRSRAVDPSVQFRKLTGGDPFKVNEKFKPLMRVSNPARIIFTANNPEVVKELMDGKDLSPYDRQAIGERILHLDVDDRAALWLAKRGDMSFTARPGHRWIAGDGGQPSDFIIARHFMYLYENRKRYSLGNRGRLLVSGNVEQESELMFQMMTQSGSAPIVLETLISFIEKTSHELDHIGWAFENRNVYVLPASVHEHFKQNIANTTKENLTLSRIMQVLRNLVSSTDTRVKLKSKQDFGRVSWQRIDPSILYKAATSYGYKCQKLHKIVHGGEL